MTAIVGTFLFSAALLLAGIESILPGRAFALQDKTLNPFMQKELQEIGDDRSLERKPVLTVKAPSDQVMNLLSSLMKEKGFKQLKKEKDLIYFGLRIPGADAQIEREYFNRNTMTPIVDDPRMIMAFGLVQKKEGLLIVARLIETSVSSSQVFNRDLTETKEGRLVLNRLLGKLKVEIERNAGNGS